MDTVMIAPSGGQEVEVLAKAKRDWGFAGDYVRGMWLMLQQAEPDDYLLATGETHSVRELLDEALSYVDLDWKEYVDVYSRYFRPTEVDLLLGDATKAREKLGWEPTVTFSELVRMMVDADMEAVQREIEGTNLSRQVEQKPITARGLDE